MVGLAPAVAVIGGLFEPCVRTKTGSKLSCEVHINEVTQRPGYYPTAALRCNQWQSAAGLFIHDWLLQRPDHPEHPGKQQARDRTR